MHRLRGVRGRLPGADQRLRNRATIDDPRVSDSPSPPLPPLQIADLDEASVWALLDDIEGAAELDGIAWKAGPTAYAETGEGSARADRTTIAAVRAAFASEVPLSLQLRYRYGGRRWCDTLLRSGSSVRLVRICEDDVRP
jgi:hypothetical protein